MPKEKKHYEICHRLENAAAKQGAFKKTLWMTACHFNNLVYEGGCYGKIIAHSRKNGLLKVSISWEDSCKELSPEELQKYIDDDMSSMPNFAFKLHILACRAQQNKNNN